MAYTFKSSNVVLRQLARDAARTPPTEEDSPFTYIDQSLTILGRNFDVYNQRLNHEFLGQRRLNATQIQEAEGKAEEYFKGLNGQIKELDQRCYDIEKRIMKHLINLEERTDKRFKESDTKIRGQFNQALSTSRNFLRTRGYEEISLVGKFDRNGELLLPPNFPKTVRRFWSLKDPPQSRRSSARFITRLLLKLLVGTQLTELIRFYDIQGWEEWHLDPDCVWDYSDSDESTRSSSHAYSGTISLEDAIRTHPKIAHRTLAVSLGLSYDKIEDFMDRAQEMARARARGPVKRRQSEPILEERKKEKIAVEEGTEVTSPAGPTELRSSDGNNQ